METRILYGEEFAFNWKLHIKEWGNEYKTLWIVTSTDDPASQVYVRNKVKLAEEIGIKVKVIHVTTVEEVNNLQYKLYHPLYNDVKVIIQQPYAEHLDLPLRLLQQNLKPTQDVDGLNYDSIYTPCTARAVMAMLKDYDLSGKHVVIVGRSDLVGKPLIDLCLDRNATVTSCNSYTKDLAKFTRQADVLIVAIGKAKYITEEYVSEGTIVIDVGINRDENRRLCGDVDFENVAPKCAAITPVPKGVGPMTCMMLMANVCGV